MISLSAADTAFCVLTFLVALLLLPIPFYLPMAWKNVGMFLFMSYMFLFLVFSFCNTIIVNPYASWCHFIARWIALTNYGLPVCLYLLSARMFNQNCREDKQVYTWRYMLLDGILGVVLPTIGCILQLFSQIHSYHFTLSPGSSAEDYCFPSSPDSTTGITFVDAPLLIITLLAVVYASIVFFTSRLPTRPMLFIYALITLISIWAYRIALIVVRARGAWTLRRAFEFEGRWVTLFLAFVWVIMWGTTREAADWYGVVARDAMAWIGRWRSGKDEHVVTPNVLPTSASSSSPVKSEKAGKEKKEKKEKEKEKKKGGKFGLHSAGTILRPSRRTLMSQYDAMSFKDVGGLLGEAEEAPPPLPAVKEDSTSDPNTNGRTTTPDIHPSLMFPSPPGGKRASTTFNINIPVQMQMPTPPSKYRTRPKSPDAYPLQTIVPVPRSPRTPPPSPPPSGSPPRSPGSPGSGSGIGIGHGGGNASGSGGGGGGSPVASPPKAKSRSKTKTKTNVPPPVMAAYPFSHDSFLELATTPKEEKMSLMQRR